MKSRSYLITLGIGATAGLTAVFIWQFGIRDTGSSLLEQPIAPVQAQAFIAPISPVQYWPIRDFNISEPVIDTKAAGVYDVEADKLLFSKNPDEKLPIASITKLMSAVIVIENLSLDEVYQVSAEDLNVDGLGADLYKNEKIRGRDLFTIMLVKSSNDAAITFAHTAAKRNMDFVALMNEKANSLGMHDTNFYDAAGLDKRSYSTVNDLLILAKYITKYPEIWTTLRQPVADVFSVDGKIAHHVISTNKLLGQVVDIIGGKTGYTDEAQGTMILVVAAPARNDNIISVVLGASDRFAATKTLIDWTRRAHKWK